MKKTMLFFMLIGAALAYALGQVSAEGPGRSGQSGGLGIFKPLDLAVAENGWGINNGDKAKIFEKIYFENRGNKSFEELLFKYLDEDDKYYWIGIYLDEPYYTKINNYDLSLKVLKAGLERARQEENKPGFLWIIGRKLYYRGRKAESLKYLIPAYTLSEKYPGTTPAWDSENEADEFEAFIKSNMKKNNY